MVTPDDDATLTVSGSTTATANRGARQYTVSNPVADTTHTIALIPAENVTIDADGVVTFADEDGGTVANPGNDAADDLGDTDAFISVVNGTTASTATAPEDLVTAMPSGGTITFTVNSTEAVSVVPVVFFDEIEDGQLELGDDAEAFGVGGAATWLPAEAATFSADSGIVVDVGDDFYTLDTDTTPDGLADVLVTFGAGESFSYTSGVLADGTTARDVNISAAQFSSWLSGPVADEDFPAVGDSVAFSNYNPGAGTTHVLDNDVPNQVTGVAASYNTRDAELTVSWDDVTNLDVSEYVIGRATFDTAEDEFGDYDTTSFTASAGDEELVLSAPAAGDYRFVVFAENDNGNLSPISASVDVTVPAGADNTSPTITGITFSDANVGTTGAGDDALTAGDQIALSFDEAVEVANGDSIEFTDDDGTVGTIELGGNATFSQSSNGQVVFITLTANPVLSEPGTTLLVDDAFEITDVVTITDEAGNALDLANSERLVFGAVQSDMTATPSSATGNTGDVITVTATVTDAGGDTIEGVTVSFADDGAARTLSSATATTNASGVATVTYTVAAGDDTTAGGTSTNVTVTASAATVADASAVIAVDNG